jgi:hypothetical protein
VRLVRDTAGAGIRLSAERWRHVVGGHPEMLMEMERVLETVGGPDYVLEGDRGTLLAVRLYDRTR